ncbi:MAG: NAD(P)H-dependent oxidoreductase [Anaerolineaceae bacterium]|jgi:NAD(P)H-dependent FMN reductase
MKTKKIIVAGSTRNNSYSQRLANHIVEPFREDYETDLIKISHLSFYRQDYQTANAPAEYEDFWSKTRSSDAVLLFRTENLRSQ